MKYIILLSLFINACTFDVKTKPAFNVGECITLTSSIESWEKPHSIYKVVKIGTEKYLVEYITPLNVKGMTDSYYFSFQDIFKVIPCPGEK